MLTLLLAFVTAAFPLRGSILQSIDSNLVIDGDTMHIVSEPCLCMCPESILTISVRKDSSLRIRSLRSGFPSYGMRLVSYMSKYLGMDASGMIKRCSTYAPYVTPARDRQFIVHGHARNWAIWADSVYPSRKHVGRFDARWRWAEYDTTMPWVRWIDSIRIGTNSPYRDLPVLTLTGTKLLDSIRPKSNASGAGLVLRAEDDTDESTRWGYRSNPDPESSRNAPVAELPEQTLRIGTTFRVIDAYRLPAAANTLKWQFLSEHRPVDSILVFGIAPSTGVVPAPQPGPKEGMEAFDLATGRRVGIDKPMPTGRHLLDTRTGTRMIVVK